jgi:hypothetical protein
MTLSQSDFFSTPLSTSNGVTTYNVIPGQIVYVYGRNLKNAPSSTTVYLENTDGVSNDSVSLSSTNIVSVNPYQVEITLPSTLSSGTYSVWVNNGSGGKYGWSKVPGMLLSATTASAATAFPTSADGPTHGWFDVSTYANSGSDNFAQIQAAVSAATTYQEDNSGKPVVIFFPNGTYNVSATGEQIILPIGMGNVEILGESQTGSVLNFSEVGVNGGGPNWGVFGIGNNDNNGNGESNVEYSNMTIQYYNSGDADLGATLIRERFVKNLVFDHVTLDAADFSPVDALGSSEVSVIDTTFRGKGSISLDSVQNATLEGDTFKLRENAEEAVINTNSSDIALFNSIAENDNDALNSDQTAVDPDGWGAGRLMVSNYRGASIVNEYIGDNQTIHLGMYDALNHYDHNSGEQILFEAGANNNLTEAVQSATYNSTADLSTVTLSSAGEITSTGVFDSSTETVWGGIDYTVFTASYSVGGATGAGTLLYDGNVYTVAAVDTPATGDFIIDGWLAPTVGDSFTLIHTPTVGQYAAVVDGTDVGADLPIQNVVQNAGTVVLTLSGYLPESLDSTSLISTTYIASNIVVYGNTLQDQTGEYGATSGSTGLHAATGVQGFAGALQVVIDGNTIENTNDGINVNGSGAPALFIQVKNNNIENVNMAGILINPGPPVVTGSSPLSYGLNDLGLIVANNTIDWNDSDAWSAALTTDQTLHNGNVEDEYGFDNAANIPAPIGIQVGGLADWRSIQNGVWDVGQTTATLAAITHNTITTDVSGASAVGIGVLQDPNLLIYANTINAGSDPDTSVPAIAFGDIEKFMPNWTLDNVTTPDALLLSNTYVGFSTDYEEVQFEGSQSGTPSTVLSTLPASTLETPNNTYTLADPAGSNLELFLPIFGDGPSTLDWTASVSGTGLSFESSSGSVNPDGTGNAVLLLDTSTATSGTYTVTLSDGTNTRTISIYLTVF